MCGEPGRYYIGKHCAIDWKAADAYTGSGIFCIRYFKKYGKVNTYIKEILNFADTPKQLNELEKLYIGNLYKSDNNCVNMMAGGSGISEYSEGSKHKISESNKGHTRTEEYRNMRREIQRGKHPSEETRQKMSISHTGKHWKWSDGTKRHRVYDNVEHTKWHLEKIN